MPAKSAKQERFMQAVAHNPAFAKKAGVPQSVGKEFTKKEGGAVKKPKKFDAGGAAQLISGATAGPMQKSMTPLTRMSAPGGVQGMGQGMQRPGGMGPMRGRFGGMRGRFGGGAGQPAPQVDNDIAAFNAGAAGRTAASRQAQMEALMKSEGDRLMKMGPPSSGRSSSLSQMMQTPGSGRSVPTAAPPGQDFIGFSGAVGAKKGGRVSSGNKDSKMKEPKAMVGKEISFMKKKGAPKSMVKHEMMEAGMKPSRAMKEGGKVAKYARGGGIEVKGKTKGKMC